MLEQPLEALSQWGHLCNLSRRPYALFCPPSAQCSFLPLSSKLTLLFVRRADPAAPPRIPGGARLSGHDCNICWRVSVPFIVPLERF
jgi:hypothetical protein